MNCSTIDCPDDSFVLFKPPIVLNEPFDYCFCLSEGLA